MCPACMIWPMSNLHSSLFLLLPFFVFFSSQGLMSVCKYFEPSPVPAPTSSTGLVVNAAWLTDSHLLMFVLIGHHLAPAIWLPSSLACVPSSFFPLLFPSAMHSPGSGFRALSLACSFPSWAVSERGHCLSYGWLQGENTLSFHAWCNHYFVSSAVPVQSLFVGRCHICGVCFPPGFSPPPDLSCFFCGLFFFLIKVFWVPFSHCYVTLLLVCYVWLMLINMFGGGVKATLNIYLLNVWQSPGNEIYLWFSELSVTPLLLLSPLLRRISSVTLPFILEIWTLIFISIWYFY